MSQWEQPVTPPPVPSGQVPPTGQDVPLPPGQPRKGWWGRNWKWFVPTGCLTLLLVVGGCIAGLVGFVFSLIKSSDAYKDALAAAQASPAVQKALGTPIEAGLLVMGNIHVSGTSGNADLTIPISGPKGEATIYAVATKSAGKWTFDRLEVAIEDSDERLDLLKEAKKKERSP